ncbi:MAG: hypothetical protein CMF33_09585, partial [Leeuwenhoekiella sp.]|nr:hypothetical protein [Leeuwenhoekiella sp.]
MKLGLVFNFEFKFKIMRLKLLFFICIIPGFLLAQNFQYLGQYDSEGTPLYLEKPNDEIDALKESMN